MSVPRPRWRALFASAFPPPVWVFVLGSLLAGCPLPRPVAAATKPFLQVRPAPPPESYAGSAACARCHADIYKSFLRTRMGRSLTPVTPAVVQTLALPASVYNQGLDRHYEVFSRNGKLFESEYQTAANGSEVFWHHAAGRLDSGRGDERHQRPGETRQLSV